MLHPADADFRTASPAILAAALLASRRDTLATFARFEATLPGLRVPQADTLNPPLWELGHIGWFQQHWLQRNPQRHLGHMADPLAPRSAAVAPVSDALFDSSAVAHTSRWQLRLPSAAHLRQSLEAGLAETLALLQHVDDGETGLYFHRLVLAHEDMHHEAALYMAQALGLPGAAAQWQPRPLLGARQWLAFEASQFEQAAPGAGFAFDNELRPHAVRLPASQIDSRVLTWAEYLDFVEDGGYAQPRWWGPTGQAWLATSQAAAPRYLQPAGLALNDTDHASHRTGWQQQINGRWQSLDTRLPACHLNAFEAEAWCAWAGRRLPSESEWERAALQGGATFQWGHVWEWTASPFQPYPGFEPHPYRDYSTPWFGSRRVLRGASFGTQPRLRHPRYRNFFTPERNDIFAGFRSCAL